MNLHTLQPEAGRRRKKRLGKGPGSGTGKTAGRGHKGSGSRSGYSISPTFEGGQTPLARKLPGKGFNNKRFATKVEFVNLVQIERLGLTDVNVAVLIEKKLIDKKAVNVKILGNGELTKAVNVEADLFSKSAEEKITKAGGKVTRREKK